MNLTGQTVEPKPEPVADDPQYLDRVRDQPCRCCGRYGPSEAHHCKDVPPHDQRGIYRRLAGMGKRSSDHDAIPLCAECHRKFHLNRAAFHAVAGFDWTHIAPTRESLGLTIGDW